MLLSSQLPTTMISFPTNHLHFVHLSLWTVHMLANATTQRLSIVIDIAIVHNNDIISNELVHSSSWIVFLWANPTTQRVSIVIVITIVHHNDSFPTILFTYCCFILMDSIHVGKCNSTKSGELLLSPQLSCLQEWYHFQPLTCLMSICHHTTSTT